MKVELTQQATIQLELTDNEVESAGLEMDAYSGGPINLGDGKPPIVVDLATLQNTGRKIPVLSQHAAQMPMGQGVAEVKDNRLQLTGSLAKIQRNEEAFELARGGFPWQASIGVYQGSVTTHKKSTEVNGQEFSGPVRVLRNGVLREVSLVSLGADPDTSATVAASMEATEPMTEKTTSTPSADFTKAAEDRQYQEKVDALLLAEVKNGSLTPQEAQERADQWLEERPSLERIELDLVRGRRSDGIQFSGQARTNRLDNNVLEAALGTFAGLGEEHYSADTLQMAQEKFPNGLSLGRLLHFAARANGYSSPDFSMTEAVVHRALPRPHIEASSSPSTYNVSGILSNVMNKMIRDAFMYVESAWRGIATVDRVTDFKQITTYSLTGDFKYKKVTNGGEITHADMGEVPYTNKAATYARMFGITREDLINDDLSAFNRVRQLLGRGAALNLNEIFWTEFLADVTTFWSVGNNNVISGAGSALSIEAVGDAYEALDMQTDPDGNFMGSSAAILLTTPKNRVLGNQITTDTATHLADAGSATERVPAPNPWAGMLRLVVSRYLQAGVPNAGADHWWLLADPMDVPTIQIVFLNGRQTPFIEQAQADFNQLGIQLRGYHDFGVAKQEYRGSVRAVGS